MDGRGRGWRLDTVKPLKSLFQALCHIRYWTRWQPEHRPRLHERQTQVARLDHPVRNLGAGTEATLVSHPPSLVPMTLLSGGQTGVDRAALDAATEVGAPTGGWCPARRWAEDGPIPARYRLRETASADPAERTRLNVRDADAVLILAPGPLTGGTRLTADVARDLRRPLLLLDPRTADPEDAADWCRQHRVAFLDVAGPRESECPGIYAEARAFVTQMLRCIARLQA